ncbi:MAG: VOC family protein, partial [Actinomycetota bacterium]
MGGPARPRGSGRQRVAPEGARPRVGKNRLHLDLYTTDMDGEVERLLGLGATRHT